MTLRKYRLESSAPLIFRARMSTVPDAISAAKLSRLPQEARDAFTRFHATKDPAAIDIVLLAAVIDFIPKKPDYEITDNMKLIDDLGFDSLAVAELVFFLEDCFQVRIETQELVKLTTIGEMRNYVAAKVGTRTD